MNFGSQTKSAPSGVKGWTVGDERASDPGREKKVDRQIARIRTILPN